MEVTKDTGEFEQDGNMFYLQQAKWQPEKHGHYFCAARDPSHPLLEQPPGPHNGQDLERKKISPKITKSFHFGGGKTHKCTIFSAKVSLSYIDLGVICINPSAIQNIRPSFVSYS
jgi:hypothetical protein